MSSYVYIPIAALCCYGFLFLAFVAAKKTKLIQAFMVMLVSGVLWTGGSFFMRMQYPPSERFWFDVSIWGLLLITYSFMLFVRDFVGSSPRLRDRFWGLGVLVVGVINTFTGVFISVPAVQTDGLGNVGFVYTITWPVIFLFFLCGGMVLEMFRHIIYCYRYDVARRKQFTSISVGIAAIFIGHLLFMLPPFQGIPVDIASGLVMVFCLFYALYRRRLFRLTLLVSKGSSYAMVALISVFAFSNLILPLDRLMARYLVVSTEQKVMMIAVLFSIFALFVYTFVKKFIDGVFIREEIIRADHLKSFSYSVTKTLKISEIMQQLVSILEETLSVRSAYIFVSKGQGQPYVMVHSENPLDNKAIQFQQDNPIIVHLKDKKECLFMEDLRRFPNFRALLEEEKRILRDLEVECFVPLLEGQSLVGIVFLTSKERGGRYNYDDISFLESVSAIASIALKNSTLYEKVYQEARTDDLTGLLNRKCFYETLEEEFLNCKETGLALILVNLDDFKLYNQLYGNKEGDLVLKRIASILEASVGAGGSVARYNAKEFGVLLPRYDLLSAKNLAKGIHRQILEMNQKSPDQSMKVLTASIGISAIPHTATSTKELVDTADLAVFQAKKSGKNAVALSSGTVERFDGTQVSVEVDHQDIYSNYAPTVYALSAAIDAKDHYTFNHSNNVSYYAMELAYGIGLGDDAVEIIREAALLHDIGKIGISESILNKPGQLTDEEYLLMQGHVENSVSIIRHLPSLDYVIPAVIGHHEWYNGRGYPRRIAGEDIPLSARILCIADAFDAMISLRPYKDAYSVFYALQELEKKAGEQFDPRLVAVFLRLVSEGRIEPRSSAEVLGSKERFVSAGE